MTIEQKIESRVSTASHYANTAARALDRGDATESLIANAIDACYSALNAIWAARATMGSIPTDAPTGDDFADLFAGKTRFETEEADILALVAPLHAAFNARTNA